MKLNPETLITDIPMSIRAKNVLIDEGVKMVKDLSNLNIRELHRVPNCGRQTVKEILGLFYPEEMGSIAEKCRQKDLADLVRLVRKYPGEAKQFLGERVDG